jgi:hypothetical protein
MISTITAGGTTASAPSAARCDFYCLHNVKGVTNMILRLCALTKNAWLFLVEEIQDATAILKRSDNKIATQPASDIETTSVLILD